VRGRRVRLSTALRWGVAVAGIVYLVGTVSLRDRVTVLNGHDGRLLRVALVHPGRESDPSFVVADPQTGAAGKVARGQLVRRTEPATVRARTASGERATVNVLGVDAAADGTRPPARFLVEEPRTRRAAWVDAADVASDWRPVGTPYPLVEVGLSRMLAEASLPLVLASLAVYSVAVVLTSYRWRRLLGALGIDMGQRTVLAINQVGAFYNNFMPGSTGGDVAKAYYASRRTPWRTRAVVSVLVDRAAGLLALIAVGGAGAWWLSSAGGATDAAARRICRGVSGTAVTVFAATAVGLLAFYHPAVRRLTRLDAILGRLPVRKQARNAVQALDDFARRPGPVLEAVAVSLPAHGAVIASAMLAGEAFGLPLSPAYYFVAVPVIVLAGVLPLAPQGVGVMEFAAVVLTRGQGVTVAQAMALAMSIRLVPMAWSLLGGLAVLRGDDRIAAGEGARPATKPVKPIDAAGGVWARRRRSGGELRERIKVAGGGNDREERPHGDGLMFGPAETHVAGFREEESQWYRTGRSSSSARAPRG
jgi:uncharacterized membrane protein YbhN (UPF0104 family)